MSDDYPIPADIFTERASSSDTLANLGPLRPLAGVWQGDEGLDINPKAEGPERNHYTERFVAEPIDAQANGPQVYYGLRYAMRALKPGELATFHDQVGYLLWEPVTSTVVMTLAIPRGQVAMAGAMVDPSAREFTLRARADDSCFRISSNPFLEAAFRTTAWDITFTIEDDNCWRYEQVTTLVVSGQGPFEHRDSNRLVRVEPPEPNPLAVAR